MTKACICEIMMDPNEEQIPKAINRRDNNGKSVPTELEDMYPFLPKEELNSNYIFVNDERYYYFREFAQDHEFIYPYYRLLEENVELDVCLLEGKPVVGILGDSNTS